MDQGFIITSLIVPWRARESESPDQNLSPLFKTVLKPIEQNHVFYEDYYSDIA